MIVTLLKWRLRREYLAYCRILDASPGGMAITTAISPRIARIRRRTRWIAQQLRARGERVPVVADLTD